jgi:chromosome segregation ATPase
MSDRWDDLERHVTGLRSDVERLAAQSEDTQRLAAATDRDLSEFKKTFRAQTKVLNALRETQSEHGKTLHHLSQAVGGLTVHVHSLDTKVSNLDTKVDTLTSRVDTLDTKVDSLADGQAEHSRMLAEILRRLPDPTSGSDAG